jgi:hypothetical protein
VRFSPRRENAPGVPREPSRQEHAPVSP